MSTYSMVFRVSGPLDVAAFIARHPAFEPTARWSKGELDRKGRVHPQSGFTLDVGDFDSAAEVAASCRQLFAEQLAALEALESIGCAMELDVGVMVEGDAPMRTVRFDVETLRLAANAGVALVVTSCAAGEDEAD